MKEFVGMAIWFKGSVGKPDMCVAVDRAEWFAVAKSQASRYGYSVAALDEPHPTAQKALMALEASVVRGEIQGMKRVRA